MDFASLFSFWPELLLDPLSELLFEKSISSYCIDMSLTDGVGSFLLEAGFGD